MIEVEIPDKLKIKKILVVDDQGSIRAVLLSFLREMGFRHIDCAVDGEDGLRLLREKAFDLVICDWAMPRISGLELLQTLRSDEANQSLPFMMVTSSSELDRVQTAVALGVSDYLIKPFQPSQLCQKVIWLLAKSRHAPRPLAADVGFSLE